MAHIVAKRPQVEPLTYLLLNRFRKLFQGVKYRHRDSSLGDSVALYLPEDLFALNRSPKFGTRVNSGERVLNIQNRLQGIKSRRGDGTFGELIPHTQIFKVPGFEVA